MKNIRIEYQWSIDGSNTKADTARFYVSGPVIALRHFHNFMQKKIEKDDWGTTVIRPKLAPDQYQITRLYESNFSTGIGVVTNDYMFPKENPIAGYDGPKSINQTVLLDLI